MHYFKGLSLLCLSVFLRGWTTSMKKYMYWHNVFLRYYTIHYGITVWLWVGEGELFVCLVGKSVYPVVIVSICEGNVLLGVATSDLLQFYFSFCKFELHLDVFSFIVISHLTKFKYFRMQVLYKKYHIFNPFTMVKLYMVCQCFSVLMQSNRIRFLMFEFDAQVNGM